MISADALVGTTNGQTNTALFAESIEVCEVVLEGASCVIHMEWEEAIAGFTSTKTSWVSATYNKLFVGLS